MVQLMLISVSSVLAILMIFLKHPLAMGFNLLCQTLMICLISSLWSSSYWFSYILFLILVGGLLVLFIYVISLASNEMFSLSIKALLLMIFSIGSLILFVYPLSNILSIYESNSELLSFSLTSEMNKENIESLSKIYSFPTCLVTLMLIVYLFITLVASVKITNLFYGPLRKMF